MRTYLALTRVQLKLFSREPIALFFTLLFPLLFLFMQGATSDNAPEIAYNGFGDIDAMVPGLTAIIIGTVALMTIPVATAGAREKQILRRLKASPMRPWHYLAADITSNYLVALAGMILLVIVAKFAFGLRLGGSPFDIFLAFSLSMFAFAAFGYTIASLSPTTRVAQVAGALLFFPMMFMGTLPPSALPELLQNIRQWLPLTQIVALLQTLWFGQGWENSSVFYLLGMLIISSLVATFTFRWE
ncbi:MAG: ABC transporter permease [Chloroflexi bacterium]|nr:ABC transporter permease [Chloroflexota bacterium]